MPNFRSIPQVFNAHHVKLGDVHMPEFALPGWVEELLEVGVLERDTQREGFVLRNDDEPEGFARLGDWILTRGDGVVRRATSQQLAEEYELVA